MDVDFNAMSRYAAGEPIPWNKLDEAAELSPHLDPPGVDLHLATGLGATLRMGDLHEGQVTPPTERATLPLPAEMQAAFHQEVLSGISISFDNQAHSSVSDEPDFTLLRDSRSVKDAAPLYANPSAAASQGTHT